MNRSSTKAKILNSVGLFEHDWQESGDCSAQTGEKGTVPFTRPSRRKSQPTSGWRLRVYYGNIHYVTDFARVVGFQWDEGNARKSFDKHSVSQAEAEQVFFNEPLLVVEDVKHSQLEPRFHALGATNAGCQLHVTFTLRTENTKIRVISAWDMHSKERSRYEKET